MPNVLCYLGLFHSQALKAALFRSLAKYYYKSNISVKMFPLIAAFYCLIAERETRKEYKYIGAYLVKSDKQYHFTLLLARKRKINDYVPNFRTSAVVNSIQNLLTAIFLCRTAKVSLFTLNLFF